MFEMLPSETSQSAVGRRTSTSAQTLCKSFCRHESQQSDLGFDEMSQSASVAISCLGMNRPTVRALSVCPSMP